MRPHSYQPLSSATKDPGRRYYVVSMIAAFTFMHLPGLVLSIMSWKKSKNAGFPTTNATTAIVINSVLFIFGIYFIVALIGFSDSMRG